MTTAESLEIAATIRSGEIFKLPMKKLEQFTVLLASPDAYAHYGASEYPRICETVRIALQARISGNLNKPSNDQSQKLQVLITEIEKQSIKFDSKNWPYFQQMCVEWGDKVAPFLNPEERNKFNRELDTIRAVICPTDLSSYRTGAPTEGAFNKMKGTAKQRLQELELNPTQNENSMDPIHLPSKVTVGWLFQLLIRLSLGSWSLLLFVIGSSFTLGYQLGQLDLRRVITTLQTQQRNQSSPGKQAIMTTAKKVSTTPALTKKQAVEK